MRWGVSVIIGKKMAEQIDHLEWDGLPENFHVPLKIIAAQKGVLMAGCKKYIDHAHEPKARSPPLARHTIFEDAPTMQQRLFTATQNWFEKQNKPHHIASLFNPSKMR